jgi:hypothetical protein
VRRNQSPSIRQRPLTGRYYLVTKNSIVFKKIQGKNKLVLKKIQSKNTMVLRKIQGKNNVVFKKIQP